MSKDKMNIVISRTDSIGDVILTIPITGYLKAKFPGCTIFFLGKTYTKAIIECSKNIDGFLNWDEMSKKSEAKQIEDLRQLNVDWFIHVFPNKEISRLVKNAGIPNRIGTSHRIFHWFTCNRLVHFSRKKSNLHESQLNFKLLKPFGITSYPELIDMESFYGLSANEHISGKLPVQIDTSKINIILHPKSKGSAREWGLDNFGKLIDLLPQEKFKIFISGTAEDKKQIKEWLEKYRGKVEDITEMLSLEQFILFISKVDALVAASTGPLHIAASMGITAIGIYPPIKPMHPERWKPIGKDAHVLVLDKYCEDCRNTEGCACMKAIKPEDVVKLLVK